MAHKAAKKMENSSQLNRTFFLFNSGISCSTRKMHSCINWSSMCGRPSPKSEILCLKIISIFVLIEFVLPDSLEAIFETALSESKVSSPKMSSKASFISKSSVFLFIFSSKNCLFYRRLTLVNLLFNFASRLRVREKLYRLGVGAVALVI